ncbi:MAG: hypothetical protein ABSG31_07350 [Tepidisphaeraceae bacterium]|jgi:deoxycytidine triphosphate deaminase
MGRSPQTKLFAEIPPGSRILLGPEIMSLASGKGLIAPFSAAHLAPSSYDLSAGARYVVAGGGVNDNTRSSPLTIGPGSYAGLISAECVKIPANLYVMLGPKRKLSYDGIVLLSGSVVDSGYEGHLLFVLYNSSGKKRIIYPGQKICVATFFQLDKAVENPIGPDPSLSAGDFPGDFLNAMANMELPSMVEINSKLDQIPLIQQRVHDLEKTYSDVTKPMKQLIESVDKVTRDVDRVSRDVQALTDQGNRVLGKIELHDKSITEHGFKLKYLVWVATVVGAVLITLAVNNLIHSGPTPSTAQSSPSSK